MQRLPGPASPVGLSTSAVVYQRSSAATARAAADPWTGTVTSKSMLLCGVSGNSSHVEHVTRRLLRSCGLYGWRGGTGMADGYSVDLGALREAADGVNGTLDQVSQRSVTDIPHDSSAVGHGSLASSLSDFLSRWKRGVDNLAKDGQQVSVRLTASANAYAKAEQDVQQHLTQQNGELTGTGTDPGAH